MMATAGVPPLPTKMKLLKGNRPDRINHNEPEPEPITLEPPHHVIKETRKEWYRIVPMLDKMGVLGNVDTAALVSAYPSRVQLAPYNTGSMHFPNAPRRGPDVFTDLADYPYELWLAKRGRSGEPVVELTISYAIPDVARFVTKVETWAGGKPIAVLYPTTRRIP